MALVEEFAEWRSIPHEPGNEMQLRPLSGMERDEAEHKQTKKGLSVFEGLELSPELYKVMRDAAKDEEDEQEPEPSQAAAKQAVKGLHREGADKYDPVTTIKYGLLDWRGPKYTKGCTETTKRQLDAVTRDWVHEEIISLSERSEGEGNGSGTTSRPASSAETSSEPIESGAAAPSSP